MNLLRSLRVLCALCVPVFAFAQAPQPPQRLAPGDNLVVEGIPAIPASLAEKAGRYGDVRSAFVQSWNPKRREMLVLTRFSETARPNRWLWRTSTAWPTSCGCWLAKWRPPPAPGSRHLFR